MSGWLPQQLGRFEHVVQHDRLIGVKLKAVQPRVAMTLAGRRDAGWVRHRDAVNIARRPVESAHGVWEDVMAKKQADTVYKIVEVVGVSEKSWEDAGRTAVETAAGTLRDLRVAEVTQMDMKVEDGKVAAFRTRVSLSFKYEA